MIDFLRFSSSRLNEMKLIEIKYNNEHSFDYSFVLQKEITKTMGKAIELNENDFEAIVLQSDIPVLVDFWSTTCGPCRAIAPILDELAEEYADEAKIVKVNVFENTNVAGKLNVSSLPTLILFDQGQMVERLVGAQSKEKLQDILDEYV